MHSSAPAGLKVIWINPAMDSEGPIGWPGSIG